MRNIEKEENPVLVATVKSKVFSVPDSTALVIITDSKLIPELTINKADMGSHSTFGILLMKYHRHYEGGYKKVI